MSEKPWDGRFAERTDTSVEAFTASIQTDKRLYPYDIEGSVAHCRMLAKVGVITDDEAGTLVEGTFTSIADVVGTTKWGWLPVSLLITQRFEAVRRVPDIGSPFLVVHGGNDRLIQPELGRRLYDAAVGPKAFVLVEGGSHHNTNSVGQPQYRAALASLFGWQDTQETASR
jgi:pimeloyl-ACP methyl ester carboxylesterase